jgi:hypothetical protein
LFQRFVQFFVITHFSLHFFQSIPPKPFSRCFWFSFNQSRQKKTIVFHSLRLSNNNRPRATFVCSPHFALPSACFVDHWNLQHLETSPLIWKLRRSLEVEYQPLRDGEKGWNSMIFTFLSCSWKPQIVRWEGSLWSLGWKVLFWMQITFDCYIWIRFKIVTNWKSSIRWNEFDWNRSSSIGWMTWLNLFINSSRINFFAESD